MDHIIIAYVTTQGERFDTAPMPANAAAMMMRDLWLYRHQGCRVLYIVRCRWRGFFDGWLPEGLTWPSEDRC